MVCFKNFVCYCSMIDKIKLFAEDLLYLMVEKLGLIRITNIVHIFILNALSKL